MPAPAIAALPLDLILSSGYLVRVTALNPVDGSTVSGVRVTDIAFQVRPVNIGTGGVVDGLAPLPLLVPTDQTT
jgi:hypothetical protein